MKKKKKQPQFVKFNVEDFLPKYRIGYERKEMANGGQLLGNTLGGIQAGMMFGPWGAAIGGALGLGSGLIQNGIEKDQRYKQAIASNAQGPNPYGNLQFKMGGKRWNYENGGFIEFKGPTHNEGGVPYKGVEVEGGETEVQVEGSPYVLSNRIINPGTGNTVAKDSKRIHRALKGRTDDISEKTLELSDKQLSNINESFKGIQKFMDEMAYGGKRKMQLGGPPDTNKYVSPSIVNFTTNPVVPQPTGYHPFYMTNDNTGHLMKSYRPNPNSPYPTRLGIPWGNLNTVSTIPNDSNLQKTRIPFDQDWEAQGIKFEPSSDLMNPLENNISSPNVNSSKLTFNPSTTISQQALNTTIIPNNITNSTIPNMTINSTNKSNNLNKNIFSNMTTGDKIQMGAQYLPALANIGRGVFGKAEVVNPNYNEYNQSMLSRAGSMNVDYQSLLNEDNLATNALRNAIRSGTNSSSVARSNLQQAYANQGERRADIKLKEQIAQNQLNMYRNQLEGQIGASNVQAEELARRETALNKSTKNNLITQGLGDLAEAGVQTGRGLNAGLFNERAFQALQAMYPNFTMADYQEFIRSKMNFTDFIKYKGY